MHNSLRLLIREMINEISNDKSFSRGFGSLEKDRLPVPDLEDNPLIAARSNDDVDVDIEEELPQVNKAR